MRAIDTSWPGGVENGLGPSRRSVPFTPSTCASVVSKPSSRAARSSVSRVRPAEKLRAAGRFERSGHRRTRALRAAAPAARAGGRPSRSARGSIRSCASPLRAAGIEAPLRVQHDALLRLAWRADRSRARDSRGSRRPASAKPGARRGLRVSFISRTAIRPVEPPGRLELHVELEAARRDAERSARAARLRSPPAASGASAAVVADLCAQPRLRRAALQAQRIRAFAERQARRAPGASETRISGPATSSLAR